MVLDYFDVFQWDKLSLNIVEYRVFMCWDGSVQLSFYESRAMGEPVAKLSLIRSELPGCHFSIRVKKIINMSTHISILCQKCPSLCAKNGTLGGQTKILKLLLCPTSQKRIELVWRVYCFCLVPVLSQFCTFPWGVDSPQQKWLSICRLWADEFKNVKLRTLECKIFRIQNLLVVKKYSYDPLNVDGGSRRYQVVQMLMGFMQ